MTSTSQVAIPSVSAITSRESDAELALIHVMNEVLGYDETSPVYQSLAYFGIFGIDDFMIVQPMNDMKGTPFPYEDPDNPSTQERGILPIALLRKFEFLQQ